MLSPQDYVLLAVAAGVGVPMTWLARKVALRCNAVNHPNPIVPQHVEPVCYFGGLAIAAATGICLASASLLGRWYPALSLERVPFSWQLALPAVGFLVLGTVDDLKVYSAGKKFLFQAVIAVAAVSLGLVYPLTGLGVFDAAFSLLWILVLVNAMNLTDVCDGLVAGLAAIMLLFWGHIDPDHALVALAASGACLGLLVFNFPPAKIFLGDGGSHLLGYLLAAIMLSSQPAQESWLRPVQMVLVVGVPLFELVLLIVVRTKKGIPWWRGSPDHLSLRIQAAGLSRPRTDGLVWLAAVGLCLTASGLEVATTAGRVAALLSVAAIVSVSFMWIQRWEVSSA